MYGIIAAAASKFSLAQFELLNKLIKVKWQESNDRIREKLLQLIGQIGKEAVSSICLHHVVHELDIFR